jgi:hypothetical protein
MDTVYTQKVSVKMHQSLSDSIYHQIFCFGFFLMNPGPDNPISVISIFFENSRRYSKLKVDDQMMLIPTK